MGYDRRVQMSIYVATDCMCYMRLSVCLPGFVAWAWAWAWIRFYQPRMHLSNGITVPTERILSRTISDTIRIYFEFKATSILSKSVISRNREHHALGGAESFTFLPLLFVRSAHLTSAERVSQLARRQPTLGRHHKQPSIILLLRLLMHTSMT